VDNGQENYNESEADTIIAESGLEPKAVMGGEAGGETQKGAEAPPLFFRFDNLGN